MSKPSQIELVSFTGKSELNIAARIVSSAGEHTFEGPGSSIHHFLSGILSAREIAKIEASQLACNHWKLLTDAVKTIQAKEFVLSDVDLRDVDADDFHRFILAFQRLDKLKVEQWTARQEHLTNDFLRKCGEKGVDHLEFPDQAPVNAGFFDVTDNGILDFLFQTVPTEVKDLVLSHAALSPQFTRHFIEKAKESPTTKDVIMNLRPIYLATQEGLADYASHQDDWGTTKVYNFKWTIGATPMFCQLYFYGGDRHDLQVYRSEDSVVTTRENAL